MKAVCVLIFVHFMLFAVADAPSGCNNAYKSSCGGCLVENGVFGPAEFILQSQSNSDRSCRAYRDATHHWCNGGVSAVSDVRAAGNFRRHSLQGPDCVTASRNCCFCSARCVDFVFYVSLFFDFVRSKPLWTASRNPLSTGVIAALW